MNSDSFAIMKEVFQDFYMRAYSSDSPVSMIGKREFGFILFEEGMNRHRRFKDREELSDFLKHSHVSDAYHSCAYYEDPEAEMDKKGWLGADLIFDIDADHIPTSCNKIHDEWTCDLCGLGGRGLVPEKCPTCGGEKLDVETWPCEGCLESAKNEVVKLLDMLLSDFGFPGECIHLFFSGHRGYHVHVESEAIQTLDSIARKEIVDYACGIGLSMLLHGLCGNATHKSDMGFPRLADPGWRGRVAKYMYRFVQDAKQADYDALGLKKASIEKLISNRDEILKSWNSAGSHVTIKGVGNETWRRILDFCAHSASAKVDTVVTTDIHRLIRLADTLHSKTGLRKVEFLPSEIRDFDPFRKAVAFKEGTLRVFVIHVPRFRLADQSFGPYKNQEVELPTAAGMFVICRNRAEVLEKHV